MLNEITLGQYIHADSFVHHLDARIKIVLTIVLMASVFFVKTFLGYALIASFLVITILASKIPLSKVLRSLKPLIFILLLTVIINLFFTKSGKILFEWKWIVISQGGIEHALFMGFRLILLVMSTALMTLTTSPITLTDGIESLFSPLKIIRFPAHELAMMMTIALRFIPTLMDETNKIMKAQLARGADFESSNLIKKAKAMVPILVPLFVSAFRRADELAMAMESRCYRGDEGRTKMTQPKLHLNDLFASLLCVALLVVVILWG